MSVPQSAIVPDHCRAAVFIEADTAADIALLAEACRRSLDAVGRFRQVYPDACVGMTVAFGADCWARFGHGGEGREIKSFRPLGGGLAPATQHDLMFHIQSQRHDVNFALAAEVMSLFDGLLTVCSETHGFRWIEDRGLDGFVDGTENPQGDDDVRRVALIGAGAADEGGSYVLLQKYRHDLRKWNRLSVAEQEASVGRSKAENIEFPRAERLSDSHLNRTNLKENGVGLKIVRRSLPFGTVSGENGLMFIAYCARLWNIEAQLLSMFGETDGQTDRLLNHLTQAVSGAYYYAPPVGRLAALV